MTSRIIRKSEPRSNYPRAPGCTRILCYNAAGLEGERILRLIDGVEIKHLKTNADERGSLTELIRRDDEFFEGFGQCYVSVSYPGVIRGWHYHKKQTDYFTCVQGMIKVPLYDLREDSPTHGELNEFYIGEDNRIVVKIPIGVLHGFKNVGVTPCYLINFPTMPYDPNDPDEYRIPYDSPDIPYDWDLKFH